LFHKGKSVALFAALKSFDSHALYIGILFMKFGVVFSGWRG